MNANLVEYDFGREVVSWLERVGYHQAMYILRCVAKVFKFAEAKEDFFRGCGLYAVGSSLHKENFNDIDLVIAGLDFRAVVSYDKIFLMDPETLIKEGVLVKPQHFLVIENEESAEPEIHQPVTSIQNPDFITFLHAFNRFGLSHNGVEYDYNFEEHGWLSGTLHGYCSNQARPSSLIKQINELFNPDDAFSLNHPFDNYGFEGNQSSIVYRFSVPAENDNLPGVRNSILSLIKPVEISIHAENLYREAWKKHQVSSKLPYLTLREWPSKNSGRERKIITDLSYPRFIDPNGEKRAQADWIFLSSYCPDETPDEVDI